MDGDDDDDNDDDNDCDGIDGCWILNIECDNFDHEMMRMMKIIMTIVLVISVYNDI